MQRLSYLNHSLCPPCSPSAAKLRDKLLSKKEAYVRALQPKLSEIVKGIIANKYTRILRRVELSRQQLEKKGFSLRNTVDEEFFRDENQVVRFEKSVSQSFESLMPQVFNQIAVALSEKLKFAPADNLLVSAIRQYTSIKGSYQHRFSCKQLLTPTIRTLHRMEKQILSEVSDPDSQGFWGVLYIFLSIFVHAFGKYLTGPQKRVVQSLICQGFVVSIIELATAIKMQIFNQQIPEQKIEDWLFQISEILK